MIDFLIQLSISFVEAQIMWALNYWDRKIRFRNNESKNDASPQKADKISN